MYPNLRILTKHVINQLISQQNQLCNKPIALPSLPLCVCVWQPATFHNTRARLHFVIRLTQDFSCLQRIFSDRVKNEIMRVCVRMKYFYVDVHVLWQNNLLLLLLLLLLLP